jgi:flagellar basal-body rod protein FlgC
MFQSLDISASALAAHRVNLDVIAGNLANMNTIRRSGDSEFGEAYQRRVALFSTTGGRFGPEGGVRIQSVELDSSPGRLVYEPGHPMAIKEGEMTGYVRYPNVDPSTEMINAMASVRAYEANVTAMDNTKRMAAAALRLIG